MKYTNTENTKKIAEKNFKKHISENSYPGRGIVIGKNTKNSWILIYWIMGRSTQSRDRIFRYENGILRVEAFSSKILKDPNYIYYNAMKDVKDKIVITNGDHTELICKKIQKGENFFTSIKSEKHESDNPNYTPRIAGIIEQSESSISLVIIARSDFSLNHSSYRYFRFPKIKSGYGYCITTYECDGNPPPNFKGDPLLLKLEGNIEKIAKKFWNALDTENRVSLLVREIKGSGKDNLKIINRFG